MSGLSLEPRADPRDPDVWRDPNGFHALRGETQVLIYTNQPEFFERVSVETIWLHRTLGGAPASAGAQVRRVKVDAVSIRFLTWTNRRLWGAGHGSGIGGSGGDGLGANLSFDISTRSFTMNNLYHPGETGIDELHRVVALAGLHDSAESFPQPKCLPETLIGHDIQEEILREIRDSSSKDAIPFEFIVASRPEPHIREVFRSPFYHHRGLNVEQSFDDVRRYLSDEFARIHCKHDTMKHIPLPWPSPDVLETLVEKSSGHFSYASTIIKFIDDKDYRPTQRLAMVQNAKSTGSESPFETLDQLYMTILNSARKQSEFIHCVQGVPKPAHV
ncbi:NACHT domain-containing protein [Mycena sanguinolenta]|uniref:NACHT domain-containing protein n=1 Tax=Mycena sanguinolenta TaxID=230812 RepID=A0A8H6WT94_9AGAR|nr:NACHT domain-containing protein [Mycena sanguinolenta]